MHLKDKFNQLRVKKKKAFIAYLPFGFPNPRMTKNMCLALEEAGVDIIELGIPFSDPLADGPIIQKATSLAIKRGANINSFLRFLSDIKKSLKIPIVIMSYSNPIFNFGLEKFFRKINQLGVSGITIVDLPLEESKEYLKKANKFNLETIFFIAPTTSSLRAKKIAKQSKGFIYYISVTGITGPKNLQFSSLAKSIKDIKRVSNTPVCVGFGIHAKSQVAKINKFSDGVIVGSSIVKFVEKNHRDKLFLEKLKQYIKSLKP